jgi:hypothetical protein
MRDHSFRSFFGYLASVCSGFEDVAAASVCERHARAGIMNLHDYAADN